MSRSNNPVPRAARIVHAAMDAARHAIWRQFRHAHSSCAALPSERLCPGKTARLFAAIALCAGLAASPLPAAASQVSLAAFPKSLIVKAGAGDDVQMLRVGVSRSLVIDFEEEIRDILISDPDIADAVVRTANRVFVLGNRIGQANLFVFGQGGRQIAAFDVSVEQDMSDLERILARMVPDARIAVESVGGNLILSGEAPSNASAKTAHDIAERFAGQFAGLPVLNMISVAGKDQIHLKVTVAELERSVIKQLGIRFSGTIGLGKFGVGFNNSPPLTVNSNIAATDRFRLAPGYTNGDKVLNGQIETLKREGVIRTLAEPTLTAVSGENASFLAGGEFPVPISGEAGSVSVSFKTFGVGLDFTPLVLSGGLINLRVKTEVSEITQQGSTTSGGVSIPGLKVRRAESTVEIPSGGTLVLAGLLQDSYKQDMTGIPGIMDIPVLGALFKSRDFQRQETELVVFVTPYIVEPAARSQFTDPRENFVPPGDISSIFFSQLNRVYTGSEVDASEPYHGDIGYVYE